MYCKECGHQIADDSKFCANCGKSQNNEVKSFAEKKQEANNLASFNTDLLKHMAVKERHNAGIWPGITALLVIGLIAFAIFKLIALPSDKSTKVNSNNYKVAEIKYEVTGTASSVNITLTNPQGGMEQYGYAKLPASYSFSVPIKRDLFGYYHAMISAQNNGSSGDVTVTIYVNGKKFRTATSRGAYVIASTDGAVEYKGIGE
ncbi:MAG: zinc ribbon domain-containing protein [Fibromonadales bacterium]|nr:zinc ribbon domain-containing protein [Fibromonadales bacterium]